jgi:hypothetical protein
MLGGIKNSYNSLMLIKHNSMYPRPKQRFLIIYDTFFKPVKTAQDYKAGSTIGVAGKKKPRNRLL